MATNPDASASASPSPTAGRRWLRQLPNTLSAARIVAAPVLVMLALTRQPAAFTWLLVPALLSDLADGWIARTFGVQSRLGAMLDSVGDASLLLAALYGLWIFHPEVIREHAVAGGLAIGAWLVEAIAALVRYRRLSSFHTYLSKIAGYLLAIFVGVLFVYGFQPWLLYLGVTFSVIANCEELALLVLLPKWRSDVGGILRVLRERRGRTAP